MHNRNKNKSDFFWHTLIFAITLVLPFLMGSPLWNDENPHGRTRAVGIALNKLEIWYGGGFNLSCIIILGLILYLVYFYKYLKPLYNTQSKILPEWLIIIASILFLAFGFLIIIYGYSYEFQPGINYNILFKLLQAIGIRWIITFILFATSLFLGYKSFKLLAIKEQV